MNDDTQPEPAASGGARHRDENATPEHVSRAEDAYRPDDATWHPASPQSPAGPGSPGAPGSAGSAGASGPGSGGHFGAGDLTEPTGPAAHSAAPYTAPRPGDAWTQHAATPTLSVPTPPPAAAATPPDQPGQYTQPSQPGQHAQPSPYGQHAQHGQYAQQGQYSGYGQPAQHAQPGRPARRGRVAAGLVAGALAIATVSGGAGAAAMLVFSDGGSTAAPVITREVTPAADRKTTAGTAESAADIIAKSVVTIAITGTDQRTGQGVQATGSGVILRTDGYVLTNNHVVADAAGGGTVTVHLPDDTTKPAKIVGTDASNDLAVVKIDGAGDLKAATFTDSASLRIGQPVLAMGAPLGLSGTVTEGIISAVNRPVRTGDGSGQDAVIDAVQTDAAINPGNSGGPLVDLSGRVVGINSAIATVSGEGGGQGSQSGNIGVGFAIPANDAVRISQQLIAHGSAQHATLGVSAQNAQDGGGAVIAQIQGGGAAAKAGLRNGDVVTAVGTRAVIDVDSLVVAIRDHQPGDKVTVTFKRGGQTQKATVTLGGKAG